MEFVLIPSGSFMMGAHGFEDGADDEKPRHKVRISKSFYMGKYEVTQEQWVAVMGSNPSEFVARKKPMEMVSWEDVQGPSSDSRRVVRGGSWCYDAWNCRPAHRSIDGPSGRAYDSGFRLVLPIGQQ